MRESRIAAGEVEVVDKGVGPAYYWSKEMTDGDELIAGKFTDVWLLGVLLYEMCWVDRPDKQHIKDAKL